MSGLPRHERRQRAAGRSAAAAAATKHDDDVDDDDAVAAEHDFESQRFLQLTKCFVCDDMIENDVVTGVLGYTPEMLKRQLPDGVLEQFVPKGPGCTCRVCGVNVHEACRGDITSSCAQVSHRFELRSYPPFSKMCYACGTNLQGLFNQGYTCAACGIVCHPGCRTNVNVRYCEATEEGAAAAAAAADRRARRQAQGRAPPAVEDTHDADDSDGDDAHWAALYEYVKTPSTAASEQDHDDDDGAAAAGGRPAFVRRSLSKKFTAAMQTAVSGARAAIGRPQQQQQQQQQQPSGPKPIQIPASLDAMGRELRKLHTQARSVNMNEAEAWVRDVAPRLRALRGDLSDHKKRLKALRSAQAKKVERRARARTLHYQTFARKLLRKGNGVGLKKAEVDAKVDDLLERFSRQRCREDELLEALEKLLPAGAAGAAARSEIAKERETGPWGPHGKLETSLRNLDRLHTQVQVATQSLEAVRRELMFPRWRHWFLRVGLEGTYVALGQLWLEQFEGSLAIRFTMLPRNSSKGDDGDEEDLVPTMVLALGGYDTEYKFADMGEAAGAAKARQKESASGMKVVARVERLSVAGNNVPLSFTVDQLSLDLEFFLNIEMEFVRSKKKGFRGAWRLKPNTFKLKFKTFGLSFKSGSLNLPDALLRTLVKNLLTSAAKQAVQAALPPEFGDYMHHVHRHTPDPLRCPGAERDQFQYHGRMSVAAELDLETMDFVLESSSADGNGRAKRGGGGLVAGVARLVAAGATRAKKKYTPRAEPVLQRVERALGLDPRQMDLFVRTQQELGLTRDNLFPDDSVRELGMKALNVQDLQSTVEAANRLGQKALAGELLSSEAPLRTVLDIVEYFLTYFGPDAHQSALTPRILALWQGALDKVQAKLAGSGSFKARASQRNVSGPGGVGAGDAQRFSETGDVVRRVVITDLIAQVLRLARKRVLTRIELVHGHLALGVGKLLEALRDRVLQAAEKSRGGNTMVFQMRNTARARKSQRGAGAADGKADDAVEDDDDDEDDFLDALFSGSGETSRRRGGAKSRHKRGTGDDDDEDDDSDGGLGHGLASAALSGAESFLDDATLDGAFGGPALSATASNAVRGAPVGQKQREKEEQIKVRYAKQAAALAFLRSSLLRELSLTLETSVGDGSFSLDVQAPELVAPVALQQLVSASTFSNMTRVNDWPWRRVARAEPESDAVHLALLRLVRRGRGAGEKDVYTKPDDGDALHLVLSGVTAALQSHGAALEHVMGMSLRRNADEGESGGSWAAPGKLTLTFDGAPELRFCASARRVRTYGSVATLHSYASDLLEWALQSVSDKRTERLSRQLLRALARYASLNTFAGSLWSHVQLNATEDDVFLSFSNPQTKDASGLDLQLEHDLTDFTDDVAALIDTYMTDPVDLGAKPDGTKLRTEG